MPNMSKYKKMKSSGNLMEKLAEARARRERVAKAKRIKGETVVPKKKPKGFAKNPGDLGKLIESQQKKKPY